MKYCINCGTELPDNAKFCFSCGASQEDKEEERKREQTFAGKIYKCPNCGAVIDSFESKCPECGYEFRGAESTKSLKEFSLKLTKAETEEEKESLIRSFPIPNTKEDVLDFMLLATSNIQIEDTEDIFNAWIIKLEQGYQKAKIIMADDEDFLIVDDLYKKTKKKTDNYKAKKTAGKVVKTTGNVIKTTGNTIKNIGFAVSKNANSFLEILLSTAWLLGFWIFITKLKNDSQFDMFLFFISAANLIFIPVILNVKNPSSKLASRIEIIASVAILVLYCKDDSQFDMFLFFHLSACFLGFIFSLAFRKEE